MKKGIIIAIGIVLAIGLAGGAYWFGAQQISPAPTKVATPTPLSQKGTIEGSMSFPGEGIPDYIEVCAENQSTKEVVCTSEHLQNPKYTYGFGYILEVPTGAYFVYALDPNRNYKAYYSEFVTCGLSIDCSSHDLILVEVKAGETISDVDPQDWYK